MKYRCKHNMYLRVPISSLSFRIGCFAAAKSMAPAMSGLKSLHDLFEIQMEYDMHLRTSALSLYPPSGPRPPASSPSGRDAAPHSFPGCRPLRPRRHRHAGPNAILRLKASIRTPFQPRGEREALKAAH